MPVIASDVGPYHDTISSGLDGMLCKSKEGWANSLELFRRPEIRKLYADNAMGIARMFDVDRNKQKIEAFFESLV